MQDIDRALAEGAKRAATYKTKDAYGDEIECFVNFPGVTVDQMKTLANGRALDYMEGPLMPYTAVIDPHTLKDLIGLRRGEAPTAAAYIAAISKHVEALKAKYGPGIDRALWDFVAEGQVKVDLLLGAEKLVEALALYRELDRRSARQPDVLRRKIEATREVVMEDAAARLDRLEARLGEGRTNKTGKANQTNRTSKTNKANKTSKTDKVHRELDRLAKALKGTALEKRVEALRAARGKTEQANGG